MLLLIAGLAELSVGNGTLLILPKDQRHTQTVVNVQTSVFLYSFIQCNEDHTCLPCVLPPEARLRTAGLSPLHLTGRTGRPGGGGNEWARGRWYQEARASA